jgi:hypothetical protein
VTTVPLALMLVVLCIKPLWLDLREQLLARRTAPR